ncbi:MAG: type I-C CRISPR-associated protein Cas8c/Csd1 [Spirochaetaceae bacterium]|jgi:CRISPR-associated protein Csd1|nr:type I-C CRISPR-associated protein Cas8c/Csd1 [Spirochaetaceae bacterium]
MILQSLKGYYDRKAADSESGIAPEGWEWKEIPFILVLDNNGRLIQIEDTREGEGAKKRGKRFLVPQRVKRTSGIAANLLWDSVDYVFGIDAKRGKKQKQAFVSRIEKEVPESSKKQAVLAFLTQEDTAVLEKTPYWNEICETKATVSFRFDGEYALYCASQEIQSALSEKAAVAQDEGLCLVTGSHDTISRTHTAIHGVWGALPKGADIVSFQEKSGYDSYGKTQGYNAPVGKKAMFAYTTALNTLLDKNSTQRMQIGDASTVFWSAAKTQFEECFRYMFDEPSKDDPDAGTRSIQNLFDSPRTGGYSEDTGSEMFYVLGLAPNAGRISIRFWRQGTVGEFAQHIRQHFIDLEIVKPQGEPVYYSLWRLLVNTAVQDKSENIPPNMAGDFMRSILDGTPYPATLLQAVLRRIKSDTEYRVKPVRAALIKAYLNRFLRTCRHYDEKEVLPVALDTNQPSIGYQLGRLFAVLEKIQEEANPGINATIRDRYYSAACSSPVTVFPTLMRLKNHHLAKMENKGRVTNLERLMSGIVGHLADFPVHLVLFEQGKFAVGYYHQRQDLFTSKKEESPADSEKTQ